MNKKKAILVTAIFAVMLAAIWLGMAAAWETGFLVATGILAALGAVKLVSAFCRWISDNNSKEAVLEPPALVYGEEADAE